MIRLAQVVFGLLVACAFGAFFVAHELKRSPSVVQRFQLKERVISPNADGRFDRQRVTFRLKRGDTVDVAIVDDKGDAVRELAVGRELPAYTQLEPSLAWDGTDDDGRPVPDGDYRVRVTLREQGRSAIIPRTFRVDRTPPRPVIASIGPQRRPGPELLPNAQGGPARIRLAQAPGNDRGRMLIFRMWPRPADLVRSLRIPAGTTLVTWDGRDARGRRAPPAPYLAVAEVRDRAGNIGTSAPLGPDGLPETVYGRELPGRGGITVRELAVQPPLLPVRAGDRVTIGVDARGRRYTWTVRRVGGPVIRRGVATRPLLRLTPPGRTSGVYLFEARRGPLRAVAPFAVDDRRRHRVLVVLGLMTWQGRNPVDDDGDGQPNLLATGLDVRLARVFGTPTTPGFAAREAPVLAWLDRERHRYDVTTDVGLATGGGPGLGGRRGVLVAGDAVWLPPVAQRRLRRFVTDGGTLAAFGVRSFQRQARLTPRLRLVNPTPPATADVFGARVGPLRRGRYDLVNDRDAFGLFRGTEGEFRGFDAAEVTAAPGPPALASSAVDDEGRVVIVGLRVGDGRVIRFGLPQLPSRIAADPDVLALAERTWDLLSR